MNASATIVDVKHLPRASRYTLDVTGAADHAEAHAASIIAVNPNPVRTRISETTVIGDDHGDFKVTMTVIFLPYSA